MKEVDPPGTFAPNQHRRFDPANRLHLRGRADAAGIVPRRPRHPAPAMSVDRPDVPHELHAASVGVTDEIGKRRAAKPNPAIEGRECRCRQPLKTSPVVATKRIVETAHGQIDGRNVRRRGDASCRLDMRAAAQQDGGKGDASSARQLHSTDFACRERAVKLETVTVGRRFLGMRACKPGCARANDSVNVRHLAHRPP